MPNCFSIRRTTRIFACHPATIVLCFRISQKKGGEIISWSQRRNLFGLALIIIGAVLLLHNLDVEVFRYVWPLIIILVGVYLIYRSTNKSSGASKLSEFRIFGDSSHTGFSDEIDGADISHFIGDARIDLSGAKLKPGVNKMNIATFIGDIRVTVPPGMAVSADCSAMFSDIQAFDRKEGGVFLSVRQKSADYDAADRKLHISCATFIGDITVTRIKPTSASVE